MTLISVLLLLTQRALASTPVHIIGCSNAACTHNCGAATLINSGVCRRVASVDSAINVTCDSAAATSVTLTVYSENSHCNGVPVQAEQVVPVGQCVSFADSYGGNDYAYFTCTTPTPPPPSPPASPGTPVYYTSCQNGCDAPCSPPTTLAPSACTHSGDIAFVANCPSVGATSLTLETFSVVSTSCLGSPVQPKDVIAAGACVPFSAYSSTSGEHGRFSCTAPPPSPPPSPPPPRAPRGIGVLYTSCDTWLGPHGHDDTAAPLKGNTTSCTSCSGPTSYAASDECLSIAYGAYAVIGHCMSVNGLMTLTFIDPPQNSDVSPCTGHVIGVVANVTTGTCIRVGEGDVVQGTFRCGHAPPVPKAPMSAAAMARIALLVIFIPQIFLCGTFVLMGILLHKPDQVLTIIDTLDERAAAAPPPASASMAVPLLAAASDPSLAPAGLAPPAADVVTISPKSVFTEEATTQNKASAIRSAIVRTRSRGGNWCCPCIPKTLHCKALYQTMYLWVMFLVSFMVLCLLIAFPSNALAFGIVFAVIACNCICGIPMYLLEFFLSSTSQYFKGMTSESEFVATIEEYRAAAPSVMLVGKCYHMETRTSYSTDANGNQVRNTYTVPVTTATPQEDVVFSSWMDTTGAVDVRGLRRTVATRVDVEKSLELGDARTAQIYQAQKTAFVLQHQHRDTHFTLTEEMDLAGHENSFLGNALVLSSTQKSVPFFLRYKVFLIVSLGCFCSWPYRLWLDSISANSQFTVRKRITIGVPDRVPASGGYMPGFAPPMASGLAPAFAPYGPAGTAPGFPSQQPAQQPPPPTFAPSFEPPTFVPFVPTL